MRSDLYHTFLSNAVQLYQLTNVKFIVKNRFLEGIYVLTMELYLVLIHIIMISYDYI